MARVNFTQALRDEYEQLFALASIRPERAFEVDSVVRRILEPTSWAKYKKVESSIGVPAYVVGIIHNLEASLNFKSHLHNGDPLTARTVRVPRGRPLGRPPFDWDTSAADALKLKKLDQWSDWSIAGIAYVLETYNGMGYRLYHPHVKSPYLWSFSSIYSSGKYVADGTWSDSAVSAQCGGMAALKRMIELGHVNLPQPAPAADRGEATITPFAEAGTLATPAAAAPPHYPGRPLKTGSSGADVVRLQEQLRMLGITEIGGADGDFGERTEHALRLFQARAVDETGAPLEIDGIAGAKTWRALFGVRSVAAVSSDSSAASPANGFRAAVLEVAASQIGVMEVPRGSNRGPEVDQYLNSVASGLLGQPWCMAFIYWCFGQAANNLNVPNPAPKTAGVLRSWRLAQGKPSARILTKADVARDPTSVEPGMVFYIDTGGGTGHAGFVTTVIGGRLTTIEGNTNEGGSREGIGVFTRTRRRIDSINVGFIAFG